MRVGAEDREFQDRCVLQEMREALLIRVRRGRRREVQSAWSWVANSGLGGS